MKLIRGWEQRFSPDAIGGLRLSKAATFRDIGEEDGLGDRREGELRTTVPATIESRSDSPIPVPATFSIHTDSDEPPIVFEDVMPGERREVQQEIRLGDSGLDSPFLLCFSREPASVSDWEVLRASLPARYDTYTITTDIDALSFEVEWGIKRWLALQEITQHEVVRYRGWVTYSYDERPPAVDPEDVLAQRRSRWFRKRRMYSGQREYRLAWEVTSPQWECFPAVIDIELTRTGLNLVEPWSPPAGRGCQETG